MKIHFSIYILHALLDEIKYLVPNFMAWIKDLHEKNSLRR